MKLCNFLLLLLVVKVTSNPIFCSQERSRQLVTHKKDVAEVYNMQVNIQIVGEQINSLIGIFSDISDQAESEGYHWEPSYLIDQDYNEIASENNITRQEEYDLMIDVQKFGVRVVNFLIWGLRD